MTRGLANRGWKGKGRQPRGEDSLSRGKVESEAEENESVSENKYK